MWEVVKFLLFTPSWGSKRRKAQQEYEERLDAAMREVDEKYPEAGEHIGVKG